MHPTLARLAPWLAGAAAQSGGAAAPAVVSFTTAGDERLQPCALDHVVAGSPQARSCTLATAPDGRLATGMWDCTAGVADFHYDCDEQVHILEGEVTVRTAGQVHELKAGSVAYFPRGSVARWEIPRYVKKVWVQRAAPRSPLQRVLGKLRRMAGPSSD